jgi:hypothetical protein
MPQPFTIDVPAAGAVNAGAVNAGALFEALLGPRTGRGAAAFAWALNGGRLQFCVSARPDLELTAGTDGRLAGNDLPGALQDPDPRSLPGLAPLPHDRLCEYLAARQVSVDHIGVNLPAREIGEARWRGFLDALDAQWPVHVLDLPGPSVVAMALAPESSSGAPGTALQAVELVYDHVAPRASLHVCVRVSTDKAETERLFAPPFGLCKPGDEAFFRSVTADAGLGVPFYIDLAYADAAFPGWTTIVAAMGRRWARAAP